MRYFTHSYRAFSRVRTDSVLFPDNLAGFMTLSMAIDVTGEMDFLTNCELNRTQRGSHLVTILSGHDLDVRPFDFIV